MNKEDYKLLPLAAVGVALGVFNVYIKPELTAERAIVGLGAVISAYELICPQNEMISHGFDRLIDKHPWATRVAIGYTALHIANLLPESIDGFHHLAEALHEK